MHSSFGIQLPPGITVVLGIVLVAAGLAAGRTELAIVGGVVFAVGVLRFALGRR